MQHHHGDRVPPPFRHSPSARYALQRRRPRRLPSGVPPVLEGSLAQTRRGNSFACTLFSCGAFAPPPTTTPPPRPPAPPLQEARAPDPPDHAEIYYRCQATDLLKASTPLPWWDFRQYVRDVWSGNVEVMDVVKAALFSVFQKTLKITAYRAQIRAYNCVQSWRGGAPYPYLWGTLDKTPREILGVQPGELVRVKAYEEILKTLNKKNKNRGLYFGSEMAPYCGSGRRVRARVERIT